MTAKAEEWQEIKERHAAKAPKLESNPGPYTNDQWLTNLCWLSFNLQLNK